MDGCFSIRNGRRELYLGRLFGGGRGGGMVLVERKGEWEACVSRAGLGSL